MSGGGKGGSQTQTTKVEIPKWLEGEARQNIDIARDVAGLGYVPYFGPDVAALTPMQNAAFDNTNAAASAFGMGASASGLPEPTEYAGGLLGYSSAPLYQQSLDALQQNAPGQYDAITGMFIDPVTGAPAASPPGGTQQQSGPLSFADAMRSGMSVMDFIGQSGGNRAPRLDDSQSNPVPAPGAYSGFGDMINGGGPGASGSTFQGGGYLSSAANTFGSPRSRDGGGGQGGK